MNARLVQNIIYGVLLLLLLGCSFFFSSADMAYGSVDIHRFDTDKGKGKKAVVARSLATNYDRTIATILFGNDVVNAGLDSIATLFGINLCYLMLTDKTLAIEQADNWGLIASLIVLVLKIMFGEILPKSVSKIKNYPMSLAYAYVIKFFTYFFSPITYPISKLGEGVSHLFKKSVPEVEIAEDDLHEMVDDIEESGEVDEEKADMMHETIRYTHTEAKEVMTPRVEVFAVNIEDPLEKILQKEDIYSYGRVLVYQETIDHVVGFFQTKTLIKKLLSGEEFSLKDILLEPLRVTETMEINDILREFKRTEKSLAIVIDEYGGLDGIITMEDILEEIVGEIWDEDDDPSAPYVKRRDGSYIVDGSLTLEDYCDLFDIDFENINTEYTTIGGFLVELLDDRFARVGDEVDFENTHIKVIAVDDNSSVEKILVRKIDPETKKPIEPLRNKIKKRRDERDEYFIKK